MKRADGMGEVYQKPRWLQWLGVGGMFVQNICFFVFYTLGS